MPSDCGNCKRKCDYVNAQWFPPRAIVYCRPQVLWYLKDAEIFRDGKWLPDPDGSTAIDAGRNGVRIPAHYAEHLAAEIDVRQRKCGMEGKLLEYEVQLDREFSPTSWKALAYMSGWRRRTEIYRHFKARKKVQKGT
ncbi:MAG: hypothetical protein WC560_10125 [Syntrophales bacterium]